MDFSSTPPRAEMSVSPARMEMRQTVGDMTGRAETKTPVTEAKAAATTTAAQRSIEPLDLFQVGDNDDIPLPPEPPRPPLALLALTPADAVPDDAQAPESDDDAAPDPTAVTARPEDASGQSDPATGLPSASAEAYLGASPEPAERTVDIRR